MLNVFLSNIIHIEIYIRCYVLKIIIICFSINFNIYKIQYENQIYI
jgi:hypothetical protein